MAVGISATLLAMVSCGGSTSGDAEQNRDSLATHGSQVTYTVALERHSAREEGCEGEFCTHVDLVIPIVQGQDSLVADKINTAVRDKFMELIKSRLPEPLGTGSWDVLTDKFIEGYKLFVMEFPDTEQKWYLEVDGSASSVNDGVFNLVVSDAEYLGGAHPNSYVLLQSFDLSDGARINLVDRFGEATLLTVAERYFRKKRDLSPSASLNDQGLMFPEGRFVLPENMALLGDTLLMIYNPYEVAAYSEGSTTLHIPVRELEKRPI